jgi:hypothetical protein
VNPFQSFLVLLAFCVGSFFTGFHPAAHARANHPSELSGSLIGRYLCTLPDNKKRVVLFMDLFQTTGGVEGFSLSGISRGLDPENREWTGIVDVISVDGQATPLKSGVVNPERLKSKAAPPGADGEPEPDLNPKLEKLSVDRTGDGPFENRIKVTIRGENGKRYRLTYDSCRFITIAEMIERSGKN